MLTYKQYLDTINDAIARINYPEQPAGLYQPIAYTMAGGGKRLRPVLTLMTCDALGGDPQQAVTAAVGIEMFHNFTLLHDDVMDRADVRRGKPTVHRRWNDNVAILSGDAMLTMATQLVAGVDPAVLQPVLELFNTTAMEIYEGQQWDMDFEQRNDVTVEEYIEMIRLKTSVLLGCACKTGAIIARATAQQTQAAYDMAVNMGLAFQLQDDYLDVWGDEKTFGKEIGGDIANNKKTYLLITALNNATGDDATALATWLADTSHPRQDKVGAVTAIYEKLGLKQAAQREIERYSMRALELLQEVVAPDSQAFETMASLIRNLMTRAN